MNMIETFKNAHMAAAERRWEAACAQMRDLLAEDNEYSALARALLTCHSMSRFYVFAGMDYAGFLGMKGYGGAPHTPCDLLEFVHRFVTYLLRKHCEPCVAYWRTTNRDDDIKSENYILCDSDDEDALPYFHRHREEYQRDTGCAWEEVEKLTAERALEIISQYEQIRVDDAADMQADLDEFGEDSMWTAADVADARGVGDEQARMITFITELGG